MKNNLILQCNYMEYKESFLIFGICIVHLFYQKIYLYAYILFFIIYLISNTNSLGYSNMFLYLTNANIYLLVMSLFISFLILYTTCNKNSLFELAIGIAIASIVYSITHYYTETKIIHE